VLPSLPAKRFDRLLGFFEVKAHESNVTVPRAETIGIVHPKILVLTILDCLKHSPAYFQPCLITSRDILRDGARKSPSSRLNIAKPRLVTTTEHPQAGDPGVHSVLNGVALHRLNMLGKPRLVKAFRLLLVQRELFFERFHFGHDNLPLCW
jgi:hypothetical protein